MNVTVNTPSEIQVSVLTDSSIQKIVATMPTITSVVSQAVPSNTSTIASSVPTEYFLTQDDRADFYPSSNPSGYVSSISGISATPTGDLTGAFIL